MKDAGVVHSTHVALPRTFLAWLAGATLSQLGDAVLYFALGWAASSYGGGAAGLVLSAVALPRTALLLIGGALGDRMGARRIMIVGDATMLVVSLSLALLAATLDTPLPLLLAAGLLIGVTDAFYLPAAGSMPRVLVPDEQVSRAIALRQSSSQLVTMVGGPLGGVLVALAGLPVAAVVDAITFALVLVVLVRIKAQFRTDEAVPRRSLLREAGEGVTLVWRTPGLRAVLMLIAACAGFVIPLGSLVIPLLTRSNGWAASAAGLIVGAQSLGTIVVTLLLARFGVAARPGLVAAGALLLTATGQTMLAFTPNVGTAAAAGLIAGVGLGLFVGHLSPVLVTAAPRSHLARVQALLSLVQSSVILVTNNVIGNVASGVNVKAALLLCAGVVAACALGAFLTPTLRQLR